jgi:hypothetical protein
LTCATITWVEGCIVGWVGGILITLLSALAIISLMPDIISLMISSASALAHANLSGPRLAEAYVSGLPCKSRLRVSSGELGISLESGPANRTVALNARWGS